MRVQELKRDSVAAWPPAWGGSYGAGTTFPAGEQGHLLHVEPRSEGGVTLIIEFDRGQHHQGILLWTTPPDVEDVLRTLERGVGQPVAQVGGLEIDERPREMSEDRCPYCGSRDVGTRGISAQAGAGAPLKEGYDCRACGHHFRRIRAPH